MSIFSLSLDDVCPHPECDIFSGSIDWCDKLIHRWPDIKIDLFVPFAYARLKDKDPFYLHNYVNWLKCINKLPDNYKINLHGFFHRRSKTDYKWHQGIESNNNEWEKLTYAQAELLLNRMEKGFKKSGMKFFKVFRPPGWHIGVEAARLLKNRGYVIAGNKTYYKKIRNMVEGVKYIPYNWDMTTPCKIKGDVVAFGHTSNWTNNYMDELRYNLIMDLLDSDKFDFKFIEELI